MRAWLVVGAVLVGLFCGVASASAAVSVSWDPSMLTSVTGSLAATEAGNRVVALPSGVSLSITGQYGVRDGMLSANSMYFPNAYGDSLAAFFKGTKIAGTYQMQMGKWSDIGVSEARLYTAILEVRRIIAGTIPSCKGYWGSSYGALQTFTGTGIGSLIRASEGKFGGLDPVWTGGWRGDFSGVNAPSSWFDWNRGVQVTRVVYILATQPDPQNPGQEIWRSACTYQDGGRYVTTHNNGSGVVGASSVNWTVHPVVDCNPTWAPADGSADLVQWRTPIVAVNDSVYLGGGVSTMAVDVAKVFEVLPSWQPGGALPGTSNQTVTSTASINPVLDNAGLGSASGLWEQLKGTWTGFNGLFDLLNLWHVYLGESGWRRVWYG